MMKKVCNLILNFLLIIIILSNICYASSPIAINIGNEYSAINNNLINSDLTEGLESEEESLSEEELMLIYYQSIEDAKKEVEYPDRCNFPTLLTQPETHPVLDDYFGIEANTKPIFRVKVDNDEDKNNMICFTFDSAFINDYTYKILDILDKYNFKCTFFMTHDFMKKNPDHIIEIVKRGHEIGNHSTTHPHFMQLTDQEIIREVWKTHCLFKYLTGLELSMFRFPYGECDERTINIVKNLGYYPIQWGTDSLDWKNDSANAILERLDMGKAYEAGNIILFHNGAKYTPNCLDEILKKATDNGLIGVRVSDMIYHHNFYLQNGTQIKNNENNN